MRDGLHLDDAPAPARFDLCKQRATFRSRNARRTLHLNAIDRDMARDLRAALAEWANDPSVAGVILRGAGRAFCAGGDVRRLHDALRSGDREGYVRGFFEAEYRLDYAIHSYAKPVLCLGHSIVMGGGLGVMTGASQRVVTPDTRLAMPEVAIGLYPDVGGSWFLRRMPGKAGLFLAITGATFNAADAIFCGVADTCIDADAFEPLLDAVRNTRWAGVPSIDRATLSRTARSHASRALPDSNIRRNLDTLNTLLADDDFDVVDRQLRQHAGSDAWLTSAIESYKAAAPLSAAVTFAIWHRAAHLSLAEAFALEYGLSLMMTKRPDFVEGVRARLVDKDKKPRWQASSITEVDAAFRYDGQALELIERS